MRAIRNNLATILAGVAVTALVVGAFLLFGRAGTSGKGDLLVIIHDGEGGEQELPLSQDATVEVKTSLGTNVIVIQDGSAYVSEADCPKRSCTQQQPISQPGQQLICLPHKLWVEVVSRDGTSSPLDPDAVTWEDEDAGVDLVAR